MAQQPETFAVYSNFDVTGGSAAKYEGQFSQLSDAHKYMVDQVKVAKVKADADRVAKLCGWN